METALLRNLTNPKTEPLNIDYCDAFFCRLKGLMFRKEVPLDYGFLFVVPINSRAGASVNMFGMRTEIAVIWINSAGKVVDKKIAKPWRLGYIPLSPARYVLETNVLNFDKFNLGDLVSIERGI